MAANGSGEPVSERIEVITKKKEMATEVHLQGFWFVCTPFDVR